VLLGKEDEAGRIIVKFDNYDGGWWGATTFSHFPTDALERFVLLGKGIDIKKGSCWLVPEVRQER
jgi:hypothetical protein